MWIRFCLGLVRLAFKMAKGEVEFGVSEWGKEGGLEGLWELMEAADEERMYWRVRQRRRKRYGRRGSR